MSGPSEQPFRREERLVASAMVVLARGQVQVVVAWQVGSAAAPCGGAQIIMLHSNLARACGRLGRHMQQDFGAAKPAPAPA